MGGNALKTTFTRRYAKDEYDRIWQEIKATLDKIGVHGQMLVCYRSKADFGDMDVLIKNNNDGQLKRLGIAKVIQNTFNPKEIVSNGNVHSFNYEELQVDFIVMQEKYFETANNYFAWNDLGNFIGAIAHKFGLKYGYDGLSYVCRSSSNQETIVGTIEVSKDIEKILEFLGFDAKVWQKGFDTPTEIFQFVCSSKYFTPALYETDQQSAAKRQQKRKLQVQLLEYIETNYKDSTRQWYEFNKDKSVDLPKVIEAFPDIQKSLQEMEELDKKRIAVRKKFNGKMIIDKYAITGPQLGSAIKRFKDLHADFDDYVLNTDSETLWTDFESVLGS